jgi:serine/threonine protein kinase
MNDPFPSKSLSVETLRSVDAVCELFEQGKQFGASVIESLLADYEGDERAALLRELLFLDVELRSRRGEVVAATDYTSFCKPQDNLIAQRAYSELSDRESASRTSAMTAILEADAHRYAFEREVGRGGIGVVWRVHDRVTVRPLAIKILHERYAGISEAHERLFHEALLTGSLQHPGIPPVFDHGRLASGLAFFTMKLVEGETLETMLNARKHAEDNFPQCIEVFRQVAQTLAYAHQQAVIHRDLKPHNIMVGRFGEVQVMDWGMAKRLSESEPNWRAAPVRHSSSEASSTAPLIGSASPGSHNLTVAGEILGTPGYMAPEQARGEVASLDARTDVFGLGAILLQILTNQRLHHSGSSREIVDRSARGDFDTAYRALESVVGRNALVCLCRRCLSFDPNLRPADSGEVAEAVTRFLTSTELRLREAEIERSRAEVEQIEQRKRQRVFNSMAVAIFVVATLGISAVGWEWLQASRLAVAEATARRRAESEAATVNDVNAYLDLLLSSARPEQFGTDVTVAEVIDAMLPDLEGRFADKPRVEGAIRRTIGKTFRSLGYDDDSVEQFRLALACFARVEPPSELDELDVKNELAGILRSRAKSTQDLQEAVALRHDVLERRSELLGEDHPLTVDVMNGLGLVYLDLGRLDEASEWLTKALHFAELDPDAVLEDLIAIRQNLAMIDYEKHDYASAEASLRELVALQGDLPLDSAWLSALNSLAIALEAQGKIEEAERFFARAITGRSEFYGPEHPLTLSSTRKLTRMLVEAGRYEAALPWLDDCLVLHNDVFGPDAGLTFGVRQYLARALVGLGRKDDAQAVLQETVQILAEGRGQDHEYTQTAREQLREFLSHSSGK